MTGISHRTVAELERPADFWASVAQFAQGLMARLDLTGVQHQYLRSIGQLIPADAHGITALDCATLRPVAVEMRGHADPGRFLDAYEEIGGRTGDLFFRYVLAKRRPVHDRMLFPGGEWAERLPEYGRLLHQDGLRHIMLVPLVRRGALVGTIHFSRTAARTPFSQRELSTARAVMGLTASAISNALRHETLERRCAAAEALVARSPAAILVSDQQGHVICESSSAAKLRSSWDSASRTSFLAALRENIAETTLTGRPASRLWSAIEVTTSAVVGARGMYTICLRETTSSRPQLATLCPPLTAREVEVLELVATGLRDQEAAAELCVTVHTVKQHLKRIYRKLGARGRADAVRLAVAAASAVSDTAAGQDG